MKIFNLLIASSLLLSLNLKAIEKENKDGVSTTDSLDAKHLNWYNFDVKVNKIVGVSVDKAYLELLQNKVSSKKIIVAVIDGGVDIYHEDLQGKIWTNKGEIPDNGIDDDNNGFIDDVNGWNFLGNKQGENISDENYEFVRLLKKYSADFDSTSTTENVLPEKLEAFNQYAIYKQRYDEEFNKLTQQKENFTGIANKIDSAVLCLNPYTKTLTPNLNDLEPVKPKNSKEKESLKFLTMILKRGFTYDRLDEASEYFDKFLNVHLNLDLNSRALIGDDIDDINDSDYGNNDVKGDRADHGSFVSGVIAANRNNEMGINGIATNVEIMVLRAVPDGDEYDKDVALAIKYAVDNGANIINMSFGKDYSPQKHMVDDAIKYAEEKGVLLVHASGNDAANNDVKHNYPEKTLNSGTDVTNWLTVGANSMVKNKNMAAVFSNYGKTTVDLFAPGVDIISLNPENKYEMASGTSFSSPVVTGVAALVWSYYPELSLSELKSVILESAVPYKNKVMLPNITSRDKTKVRFSELSVTGGIVNAYNALQLAEQKTKGTVAEAK